MDLQPDDNTASMPPRDRRQWSWYLEEWSCLNLNATETDLVRRGHTPNGQKVEQGWHQMAAIHNAMWRSAPGDVQVRAGEVLANEYARKWRPEGSTKWRFNVLRTSGSWSAAEMAARSSLRLAIEAWATHLGVELGPGPFQGNDAVGGNINPSPPAGANAAVRAQWNHGQGQVDPAVPALGTHVPASPPGWPVGVVWPPAPGVALPAGFGAPAAAPATMAPPPVVPAGPQAGPTAPPAIPAAPPALPAAPPAITAAAPAVPAASTILPPPIQSAPTPTNPPVQPTMAATAQQPAVAQTEEDEEADADEEITTAAQPARVQTAGEYLAAKRKRDGEEAEEEETEEEKRRRDRERQERIKRIQRENAELTRRYPDRPLF